MTQEPANPHTQYAYIFGSLGRTRLLIKKQVHLLVTNCKDIGFLKLYTSTVTPAFLRKFDQPSVFLDSSLVIQCAHIPSKPVSYIKREIAAIVEPPKGKKRLRKSSGITEQGACKRKKQGNGNG